MQALVSDFLETCDERLADLGWAPLVYCTLRGSAEQARLWRRGRTKSIVDNEIARLRLRGNLEAVRYIVEAGPQPGSKRSERVTNAIPGSSAHNYGLAIDCVPLRAGKALWTDTGALAQMGALGEGVGLEWSGRWTRFKETAHFQHPEWREQIA
jgi:peptidoglycan L-alanyl-D-glutamate endopeptidase CwlK